MKNKNENYPPVYEAYGYNDMKSFIEAIKEHVIASSMEQSLIKKAPKKTKG